MTIMGPNDPRAMRRDDPNLYRPKGETLMEQIDDAADMMIGNMTEKDWDELEKALDSLPPSLDT